MNLKMVIKRSGTKVNYDRNKIKSAISGANRDASTPQDRLKAADIELVTEAIETRCC